MSTATIDRLKWAVGRLAVLKDNEWVRYEGRQTFLEAMAELDDIINTFVDHSAEPAPVQLLAMNSDQVDQVLARLVAAIPAPDLGGVVADVAAEIHRSDVELLGALAEVQREVIAAIENPIDTPAAA
jgi:hypothetical protein